MGTPIIGDLLQNTVGKVVDRLAEKYLPSQLGEKERLELKNEAGRIALEEYRAAAGELQGARELAGKDGDGAPAWTKVMTVTHRPVWSFITLVVFIWTVIAPYAGFAEMPLTEIHKDIMQTVIIFYFGGRSIEKAAGIMWGR